MLTTTEEFKIAAEIKTLMNQSGVPAKDWYVGITKDENQRNANGRGIDIEDKANYFCTNAGTRKSACRIETYFIEEIGTDGGKPCNGGDEESSYVYAINTRVYPITEELLLEFKRTT